MYTLLAQRSTVQMSVPHPRTGLGWCLPTNESSSQPACFAQLCSSIMSSPDCSSLPPLSHRQRQLFVSERLGSMVPAKLEDVFCTWQYQSSPSLWPTLGYWSTTQSSRAPASGCFWGKCVIVRAFLGFDRANCDSSNRSEEQKTKSNKSVALNYSTLMSLGFIHFFLFS